MVELIFNWEVYEPFGQYSVAHDASGRRYYVLRGSALQVLGMNREHLPPKDFEAYEETRVRQIKFDGNPRTVSYEVNLVTDLEIKRRLACLFWDRFKP